MNMKLSIVSFAAFLLILHAPSNNACTLPVPSAFNIENFNDMFLWKIMNCTLESKESASKVLESVHGINQNISDYFGKLTKYIGSSKPRRLTKFAHELQDIVKINEMFEIILRHFKNTIYEEFDEARRKNVSSLSDYFLANYLRLFRFFDGTIFDELKNLNNVCKMGKSQHQFFSDLLINLQSVIAHTYTTVDILDQLLMSENFDAGQDMKLRINEKYKHFTTNFQFFKKGLSREFYICGVNASGTGTHNNSIELKAFQRYLFTTNQITPGYFYQIDNECPTDCAVVNNMKVKDKIVCNEKKDSYAGPYQTFIDKEHNSSNDDICLLTKKCNKLHCPERDNDRRLYGVAHMCINPNSEERYQFYLHNAKLQRECTGESKMLTYQDRGDIVYFNWFPRYASPRDCPLCDCVCADNDYYISTQFAVADILDHKVVVGSRFKMLENTLYIEILQGRLLPNGSIDASTLSWKNASNLLRDMAQMSVKLDWNDMRSIDLTTTMVPEGRAVVGLGFRIIQGHKQRIGLAAFSTAYDFVNGKLTEDYYKGYESMAKKELKLAGTRKPVWSSDIRPISKDDEFLKFTTSHEASDGGQSTVPFIDAQPVVPPILKPLSGVGLFYKAQKTFGGFIGFKLIEYDTAPDVNIDSNKPKEEQKDFLS